MDYCFNAKIAVREVHGLHGHDRSGPTETAGQGGQGFGDLRSPPRMPGSSKVLGESLKHTVLKLSMMLSLYC